MQLISSVQKPASLMVWGCMSALWHWQLTHLERHLNAEMYIQVLEQHMLPSDVVSFREDLAFSNMTMPDHILHQLQHHGCVEEGSGY